MKIEVSNGEIFDKYTILEIKLDRSNDPVKTRNIEKEFDYLKKIIDVIEIPNELIQELKKVNLKLWDIEDRLRILESQNNFNAEFIDLARQVYFTNDKRAEIKYSINLLTSSNFIEEKILPDYRNKEK